MREAIHDISDIIGEASIAGKNINVVSEITGDTIMCTTVSAGALFGPLWLRNR